MGYKRLEAEDFLVSSNTITSVVWSNYQPSLSTFFTSSTQKEGSTGPYYLNVFQTTPTNPSAEVQFSIAYGDVTGGGNIIFDSSTPTVSPSTTIYGQYRTLILEDENSSFKFGNDIPVNHFYIISLERARYKEKLLPGSLNLTLKSNNSAYDVINLTDDFNMVTLPTYYGAQRAYQLISGSDGVAVTGGNGYASSGSYGLFLPDISTIILNGNVLDDNSPTGGGINLGTIRETNNANNPSKLFESIKVGGEFRLNSQETITSDYVFIRARNSEFNYSENPSFISGSTGEVIYDYFIDNPQVYPTTVGLYNDANELLAVAKMSKPIPKNFIHEALITVKLDF
jgi:hypothetical protein